jgi:hypothetical protein
MKVVEDDVWGSDIAISISELASSIPPRLAAIIADADKLSNALVPPRGYRAAEARHALANAIDRVSVAAADFRRVAELLKG